MNFCDVSTITIVGYAQNAVVLYKNVSEQVSCHFIALENCNRFSPAAAKVPGPWGCRW